VAIWTAIREMDKPKLVGAYLEAAGFTDIQSAMLAQGWRSDPLTVVVGRA
jgi:hypothetical protein